jgi:hypothetical protein
MVCHTLEKLLPSTTKDQPGREGMVYIFGDCELDMHYYTLRRKVRAVGEEGGYYHA